MRYVLILFAVFALALTSCGNKAEKKAEKPAPAVKAANPNGLTDFQMENGIGPVTEKLNLGEIDEAKAKKGEAAFKVKCAACHKLDARFIGPAQRYTADRRSPEYIVNMMMNPDTMLAKHPTAQKMLAEYKAPMANMHIQLPEAMNILEYMRKVAKEGHEKNIPEVPVFAEKK